LESLLQVRREIQRAKIPRRFSAENVAGIAGLLYSDHILAVETRAHCCSSPRLEPSPSRIGAGGPRHDPLSNYLIVGAVLFVLE